VTSQKARLTTLAACTVRIAGPDTQGTGFFVTSNVVATCAHVLFDKAGKSIATTMSWASREFGIDYARVSWTAGDDIAIVVLDDVECDVIFPLTAELDLDQLLYAFGYPDDYPGGDSVTLQYEGPTRGLRPLLKFKGGLVRPGMSGAPLLNMRNGTIVGMLTTTRDRRFATGGRGIPINSLTTIFPGIGIWADTRFGPRQGGLSRDEVAHVQARAQEDQLAARLRLIRDEQASHTVSGSQRIRARDLFGEEPTLVPFRARAALADEQETVDPLALLLERIETAGDRALRDGLHVVATGPPGTGKSTFATAMSQELTARFLEGRRSVVPILLDLRDYRDQGADSGFGTLAWVQERLDEITGTRALLRAADENARPYPVIILDSLDEYFAGKPPAIIADIAGRYIFRRGNIACCRAIYYEQHLAMLPAVAQFERFDILSWQREDVQLYVRRYYRRLFREQGDSLAEEFIRQIGNSGSLMAVCSVPLRLNMALDLLRPGRDELGKASTLLGLYHTYVSLLLATEAGKGGSVLSGDEKSQYLELLAWHFYDEGNLGDTQAPPFTHSEFETFLAKPEHRHQAFTVNQIAQDIRSRSLLQEDGGIFSSIEPGTLSFEHKSFQEYLVARHMFHALLGDASAVASIFRRQVSAEVSEFLKEYLGRARSSSRIMSKIVQNLNEAYDINADVAANSNLTESAKARIGKAQIGYYLGVLQSPLTIPVLELIYERESDPWIRRGISVGLSLGGTEDKYHEYINRLRQERSAKTQQLENDVNVGFHLSFFGDQPFDPLRPDVDQGGPDCSRTIQRLVYQLDTETDRGSWRLNLYTLQDLWHHRQVSRRSSGGALAQHAAALQRIVGKLRSDPWSAWWPELDEVEAAVAEAIEI
jgi:hypothetical protein